MKKDEGGQVVCEKCGALFIDGEYVSMVAGGDITWKDSVKESIKFQYDADDVYLYHSNDKCRGHVRISPRPYTIDAVKAALALMSRQEQYLIYKFLHDACDQRL